MIKLKDFVDVNLHSINPSSNEANKTVVYIYGANATRIDKVLNASNYKTEYTGFDTPAKAFVEQFFNLGGASLRVIQIATTQATSTNVVKTNNDLFLTEISNLPMEQVAVVVRQATADTSGDPNYDSAGYHYETFDVEDQGGTVQVEGFNLILANINNKVTDYGTAYRKLLVRFLAPTGGSGYTTQNITNLKRDENLIWKLTTTETDLASILAYFSKVTINNPDTLKDYNFTEEFTCTDMYLTFTNVDWNDIKDFINTDADIFQKTPREPINLGGNTSAGFDMIQEFESIYISQQIVNKEFELLRKKISLTDARSLLHSALVDVLEPYYAIGYLIQAEYTEANVYRNVNGQNICILAEGEVIDGGYKIIILPKKAGEDVHNFPEIEVIINTNKGIRYIKTTGIVL